jgi:hypothetical protein
MPNHFHLVLRVEEEQALQIGMHGLQMSYAKALNLSLGRSGPLFQGRYSTRIVPTTERLLHLTRYVHLNPVTSGLVSRPEEWAHSSYPSYIEGGDPLLHTGLVLDMLAPGQPLVSQRSMYRRFVEGETL